MAQSPVNHTKGNMIKPKTIRLPESVVMAGTDKNGKLRHRTIPRDRVKEPHIGIPVVLCVLSMTHSIALETALEEVFDGCLPDATQDQIAASTCLALYDMHLQLLKQDIGFDVDVNKRMRRELKSRKIFGEHSL